MSTELESLAVPLLKGALPSAITDQPAVLVIYLLLILIVASGLASVVLRNLVFAIGSFSATMGLVALLYLMLAPFLLVALQLLLFTSVSAALLLGLLRRTSGLDPAPDSPFGAELIAGVAAGAALLALLGVVVGATNWPVKAVGISEGFSGALASQFVVAIAVIVVVLSSAALGAALLVSQRLRRRISR